MGFTERKSTSPSQLKETELLQVTYNCMEKRHLERKYGKSLNWNIGINQGANSGDVKDDIFVFSTVDKQLSDASCSFASQVHVK